MVDGSGNILDFVGVGTNGYDNAFIGLASIWDYDIFWNELETKMISGELVAAFTDSKKYPSFKAKPLKWLDTGNLDDLSRTREYFKDQPLSLFKVTDEITYKENKFIKFNPDTTFIVNKSKRADALKGLVPAGFSSTKHFISYDWEAGNTLYESDSALLYKSFLDMFSEVIEKAEKYKGDRELFEKFYVEKTLQRRERFVGKFGTRYFTERYEVNGVKYDSLENILKKVNTVCLYDSTLYTLFHGDLQFDNIVYCPETQKFTYIDWRESFGGSAKGGDLYYDLAKLYGGSIIPYNLMKKEDSIKLSEGTTVVEYSYKVTDSLMHFRGDYEKWIVEKGYNLQKVKLITAFIFLNMSPLHDEKFGKMLWFKSIELFNELSK